MVMYTSGALASDEVLGAEVTRDFVGLVRWS